MPSNDLFLENLPRRRLNACDSDPSPVWEQPPPSSSSSSAATLVPRLSISTSATSSVSTPVTTGDNYSVPISGAIVASPRQQQQQPQHHHQPQSYLQPRQHSSHSASSFTFPDYINFLPDFTATRVDDDDEDAVLRGRRTARPRLIPDFVSSNSATTICVLFQELRLYNSRVYQLRLTDVARVDDEEDAGADDDDNAVARQANYEENDVAGVLSTERLVSTVSLPCVYLNAYALTCDIPAHLAPGLRRARVIDATSGSDSGVEFGAPAFLTVDSASESLSRLIESSTNPLSALADALGLDVSDNATLDRHLCKLFRQNTPYEPFDRALRLSSSSSSPSSPRPTSRKYPSLLHLAAAYGLKDLCANMIDCPGVEVTIFLVT